MNKKELEKIIQEIKDGTALQVELIAFADELANDDQKKYFHVHNLTIADVLDGGVLRRFERSVVKGIYKTWNDKISAILGEKLEVFVLED